MRRDCFSLLHYTYTLHTGENTCIYYTRILHPGENGPNLSEVHRATAPDDRQHDKGEDLTFFLLVP